MRRWTKSKRLEILSTPKYLPQELHLEYKSMGEGMYIEMYRHRYLLVNGETDDSVRKKVGGNHEAR
jgi:hypothetical protein